MLQICVPAALVEVVNEDVESMIIHLHYRLDEDKGNAY